jgi:tRNA-splicing ligase RtcB (3'-phosphate/5'-hydroxy nucleic acid ligase)
MTATFAAWLADPLAPDVARSLERLRSAEDVVRVAAMPDVHLAEDVCIGVAVATTHRIYPAAVGSDIGCGMAALRFDCGADVIAGEAAAARVLTALQREVPILVHPRSAMTSSLPEGLDDEPLSSPSLDTRRRRDGRLEFGTVGRGNHFVELQADDEGALWLMVHSGSRAMGGAIRDHHLRRTSADATGLAFLDADADEGRAYLGDHAWALRYAAANRQAIVAAAAAIVARLFGARPDAASLIACTHNHVRREVHDGAELWVHRKGAISAAEGEPGVIPGSMGTWSFHTCGRGEPGSLRSSSHGAGRAMSRSEARARIRRRDFERDVEGVWFDHRLARRLVEEAPGAYRDIGRVMRAQRDLTRVVRRLRPVLVYKGA